MNKDFEIDLGTLRVVLAVAECLSYTRAAHKLGITQPAVSKRITALERKLRTKLFRRDGQRFFPTDACSALCERAEQIFSLVDQLTESTLHFSERPTGSVAIGVPQSTGERLLPLLVPAFRDRYPGIFVRVEQGYVADLFEQLMAKRIDIAILFGHFSSPNVELVPLADHELGILYPASWSRRSPLGYPVPEEISLKEAALLPLIAPSIEQSLRPLIERTFHAARLRPNIAIEINSLALQMSLVETGFGCIFITERAKLGARNGSAMKFARLADASMTWPMSMAFRRHGQNTQAAKLMMAMIQDCMPALMR
ncbi:LysR family transcriptional regulator [Parapusillimonas granuli]|uniref:LysR family transcriptional regulator n=1 Tax=Parapusillimonas granuli TaxID=380911 RepID=A0A853G1E4_9BURK|nr:LysR family transcriptional regulator [Parapusillimonas granuli]MBB5214732.1 LysR family nitrogen assimilation transcriptional regulator [Parapusillimonas granuli]MEB2398020.1 LysR family transcriptional regulator [Alcaligenaceae bacterium]NYT48860.1 LysR family transcriptional regulator [Parapusillimonas granuli]